MVGLLNTFSFGDAIFEKRIDVADFKVDLAASIIVGMACFSCCSTPFPWHRWFALIANQTQRWRKTRKNLVNIPFYTRDTWSIQANYVSAVLYVSTCKHGTSCQTENKAFSCVSRCTNSDCSSWRIICLVPLLTITGITIQTYDSNDERLYRPLHALSVAANP